MAFFKKLGNFASKVGKAAVKVGSAVGKVALSAAPTLLSAIPVVGPVASIGAKLVTKIPIAKMAASALKAGHIDKAKVAETLIKNGLPAHPEAVADATAVINQHVEIQKSLPIAQMAAKAVESGSVDLAKITETIKAQGVEATPQLVETVKQGVTSHIVSDDTNPIQSTAQVKVTSANLSVTDKIKTLFHKYWVVAALVLPLGFLLLIPKLRR